MNYSSRKYTFCLEVNQKPVLRQIWTDLAYYQQKTCFKEPYSRTLKCNFREEMVDEKKRGDTKSENITHKTRKIIT